MKSNRSGVLFLAGLAMAGSATAQCGAWTAVTGPPGVNGRILAQVVWDRDGSGPLPPVLVVGGAFTVAGGVACQRIAAFDPVARTWSALGAGVAGGVVSALAVASNGDLIAGGNFNAAGGGSAAGIARWNGISWAPLGAGLGQSASVLALATLPNGDIVAGGNMVSYVTRWNGVAWSPLGGGVNGEVSCLAVAANGDVFAGGQFTLAGATPTNRVARWNGTTWSALGLAASVVRVDALVIDSAGDLIAATVGPGIGVSRWSGSAWSAVGSLTGAAFTFPDSRARLLAWNAGQLLLGGVSSPGVRWWNGSAWVGLAANGFDRVFAMTRLPHGDFAVGGEFAYANNRFVSNFALREAGDWSGSGGYGGLVATAVRTQNGDLLVGGNFPEGPGTAAGGIARWNGTSWSGLGAGVQADGNYSANALVELASGDVIAGGFFWFATASGVASNLARWNGAQWAPLGGGVDGPVSAMLLLSNGDLVIGGTFSAAGGVPCSNVARWNGVSWSPLGSGTNGCVRYLASGPNGSLVVAGCFSSAGGAAANRIASWNGATWSPIGDATPFYADVRSLDVDVDGSVVVCDGRLRRWSGSAWQDLWSVPPSFSNDYLLSAALLSDGDWLLSTFDARLLRGGPGAWQLVPPGLVTTQGPKLAASPAGGFFALSAGVAAYTSSCPATVSPFGSGCAGSGGVAALAAESLPWLGGGLRTRASNLPSSSLAIVALGFSSLNLMFPPEFPPSSAPGCALLVSPDALSASIAGASLPITLPIPNGAALVGLVLYQQVVALEIAGGALVATTSTNGLMATIGAF
jgi:hypothetical protein